MKTATHSYKIGSRKDKNGKGAISFKLSYGYKVYNPTTNKYDARPFEYATLQKLHPSEWDNETYRPTKDYIRRNGNDITNALALIEKLSYAELSYYREQNGIDPTPDQLKKKVDLKLGRSNDVPTDSRLTTFIQKKIDERQAIPIGTKGYWDKKTAKQYLTVIPKLERFEKSINKVLTFDNLTYLDCQNYLHTLSNLYQKENGKEYSQSTINKEFRHFRAILNMALESDIELMFRPNFKQLAIPSGTKDHKTYLTLEMLTKIIQTDVSYSKMLTHGKNYLILSSLTGLRISDMQNLHKQKIDEVTHKGNKIHLLTTEIEKSGAKEKHKEKLITTIPLPITVVEMYKANGNAFPKFPSEPNIRKYVKLILAKHFPDMTSELTINKFGKPITKETKLFSELYTPHDCRATTITNLTNLGVFRQLHEPITHPKHNAKDVYDGYDNSTLNELAFRIVDNIKQTDSYPFIYH